MTDIVDRLRLTNADFLHEEAADEIVRLREERDTARAQAANADAQCERDAERAERAEAERDHWKNYSASQGRALQGGVVIPNEEYAALCAERDRLRDALKDIESPSIDIVCHGSWEAFEWAIERAAEALKENDQ